MKYSTLKHLFIIFFLFTFAKVYSQDSAYVRKTINQLTSKKFWGRGYTKDGMGKASDFLAAEYEKIGLLPIGKNYKQEFTYPVNTFPGKMFVEVNGKKLTPGKDFIVNNESPSLNQKIKLTKIDSALYDGGSNLQVFLKDKLTWSVASQVSSIAKIEINRNFFKENPELIQVDIENKFVSDFKASNIIGYVKGTKYPDSMLLITAHYDHLGGMGAETFFPGANDNAAGVATLLSLAKFYAANAQPYSIGFICFAGEEAGLLGSRYFTENPLIPLGKIKFLINLDLVGTGESGMTVVNASIYPKAFSILNQVNQESGFISKINSRGKAANSDHYFFTEKGVPAFFFYTQGGIAAYHDIFDKPETLPLTEYNDLFRLIVNFNKIILNN